CDWLLCPRNCSSPGLIRWNIKRSRLPEADARSFCSPAWIKSMFMLKLMHSSAMLPCSFSF
ncbi:hypothetical protein ATANTOWER_016468, partial [Ataeniobius toweri]|nr:hypothetical protein [Ataeniobius toweri]